MSKSNLEKKADNDSHAIFSILKSHNNYGDVVSMFKKGPPPEEGFAWCSHNVGWWTEDESDAIKDVSDEVLKRGWDSSGYCFMMRLIQRMVMFDVECKAMQKIIETKQNKD